jgi:methylmalonyl-CoA mutase cobalamin-binding subunit
MDAKRLEEGVNASLVRLGLQGVLQRVVGPFATQIGELWQEGELTAAHEHFASGAIKGFLTAASRPFAATETAPGLVVATPAGQLHELGAMIAACFATNLGWRVAYLGASLPAAEIAGAVRENRARALALSIVYPADDPALSQELVTLRRFIDSAVPILVGGRSARAYQEALLKIRGTLTMDLGEFGEVLQAIREPEPEA